MRRRKGWKRRGKKKDNDRVHVMKKAKARYGIPMNRLQRQDAIQQIKTNRSTFVRRSTRTRVLHIVTIEGEDMLVVYDSKHHRLITALPKRALEREKRYSNVTGTEGT